MPQSHTWQSLSMCCQTPLGADWKSCPPGMLSGFSQSKCWEHLASCWCYEAYVSVKQEDWKVHLSSELVVLHLFIFPDRTENPNMGQFSRAGPPTFHWKATALQPAKEGTVWIVATIVSRGRLQGSWCMICGPARETSKCEGALLTCMAIVLLIYLSVKWSSS